MYKNLKIINEKEADNYFIRNKKNIYNKIVSQKNYIIECFKATQIKPKNILEIGCFNGYKLEIYRKYFLSKKIKCKLFGIDLSSKAIEDGKKRYPKLHLKKLSSLKIQKLNSKFDLIICDFLYLLDREYIFEQFDKTTGNLYVL